MKTQSVQLLDKTFTVRELSIKDLRVWLDHLATTKEDDPVAALVLESTHLHDLAHVCDVLVSELERFTPSQLDPLVKVARELNPGLFKMRTGMALAAQAILAESGAKSKRVTQ